MVPPDEPPTASAPPSEKRDSLYAQVMSDPDARHAYFDTTQGTLESSRHHPDLGKIRDVLTEASIAYLFNANDRRPHPVFRTASSVDVGTEAIIARIAALAAAG